MSRLFYVIYAVVVVLISTGINSAQTGKQGSAGRGWGSSGYHSGGSGWSYGGGHK